MKRKDLKIGQLFVYSTAPMVPMLVVPDSLTTSEANNQALKAGVSNFSNTSTARPCWEDDVIIMEPKGKSASKAEPLIAQQALISQPHYVMRPEPVEAIEGWGYANNWYRANAIAYLARAGKKENVSAESDLLKAITFIVREITSSRGGNDAASWDPSSIAHLFRS